MTEDDEIMAEDKLELLFRKQKGFRDQFIKNNPDNEYVKERYPYERVIKLHLADDDEKAEERRVISWKHWKKKNADGTYVNGSLIDTAFSKEDQATQKQFDEAGSVKEYLQNEFVDRLHFFVQEAIELGFTPDLLIEKYLAKHEENYNRQARGY
jgi:hypothetical protein